MNRSDVRADRRWERAAREHRAALDTFVRLISALPPGEWRAAPDGARWSPAELTEHLALGYQVALREIKIGRGPASRVPRPAQPLFRWFLLPHMLFHRSMPLVRPAPETLPGGASSMPGEGVARLRGRAEAVEAALAARPELRLTHPYFGAIDRVKCWRLAALHLEHHGRQLSEALTSTGASGSPTRR